MFDVEYDEIVDATVAVKGQYYSECDDDLPPAQWQKEFWGNETYSQLLNIKKKYDPDNHFTCLQCVGSGDVQSTTTTSTTTTPTTTTTTSQAPTTTTSLLSQASSAARPQVSMAVILLVFAAAAVG